MGGLNRIQMSIGLEFPVLVRRHSSIDLQYDASVLTVPMSVVIPRKAGAEHYALLQVTTQPDSRIGPKSKFADDLVLLLEDVADVHGIELLWCIVGKRLFFEKFVSVGMCIHAS